MGIDTNKLTDNFSVKAFMQGLAVVVLIYASMGVWLSLSADKTLKKMEGKLAAQTVLIDHQMRPGSKNKHLSLIHI